MDNLPFVCSALPLVQFNLQLCQAVLATHANEKQQPHSHRGSSADTTAAIGSLPRPSCFPATWLATTAADATIVAATAAAGDFADTAAAAAIAAAVAIHPASSTQHVFRTVQTRIRWAQSAAQLVVFVSDFLRGPVRDIDIHTFHEIQRG